MFKPAALQLIDDQRHLLAGADQQRAQADRIRVDFDRFGDDRFGRHLFAQVNDRVAVVGQDGFDQVLADIVHIAVDGGQHQGAFGDAFFLFQVVFQVSERIFSSPRRIGAQRAGSIHPRQIYRRPPSWPAAGRC